LVVAVAGDLDHDRVVAGLADRAASTEEGSARSGRAPTTV